VDGLPTLIGVAIRDIEANEPITISYDWTVRDKKYQRIKCCCGEEKCRKYIIYCPTDEKGTKMSPFDKPCLETVPPTSAELFTKSFYNCHIKHL
jgi:hypothetical protein